MDEFVFDSFRNYYNALYKLGYLNDHKADSLLILHFYYDLLCCNYRGTVKKEDYKLIERALYCLFGINCLIPYPNIAMGQLKLGDLPELLARLKNLENEKVIKPLHPSEEPGDHEIIVDDVPFPEGVTIG